MSSGRTHPIAIFAIKTVHTAVFLVMLASILWLAISGLLRRRDRTVAAAAGLVAIEAAVFVANDGVCPLTPLTERLGATRLGLGHLPAGPGRPNDPDLGDRARRRGGLVPRPLRVSGRPDGPTATNTGGQEEEPR